MARIIDADGHITEPRVLWEQYTESAYRDRVIQIRRNAEGRDEFWINGQRRSPVGASVATSMIPGGFLDPERARNLTWDDLLPGSYEPLWREAQELDVPVAVHSSFGTKMPTLGADRYLRDVFSFHMVCHPFEQQAACMDIICGGVLERFPKLKLGFLESGVGWVGYWLDRMDSHYRKMGAMVPWLHRRPSEDFMEPCYLTLDPDVLTLQAMC